MEIHFDTHWDCLLLLPLLALSDVACSECEQDNGWAISIGWLHWELSLIYDPCC